MPPPQREEGEAGEIPDAPPRRENAQRYSTTTSTSSYASLAFDPPSHLQRMSSNASDDSRRGGGRSLAPRGRDGGRFGGRNGTHNSGRDEYQHHPPMRPDSRFSEELFRPGPPIHRGAPPGRNFPPGGRFPPRGGGRWNGGRERIEDPDIIHESISTFSSGNPAPFMRGGRGPFVPRGGPDGRGRAFMSRGGGMESQGRPLPRGGRGMDGRGGRAVSTGGVEGRGPHMSHRPPPESFTKRTYSDFGNDPPASFPDTKRIRGNPSFGSEGEIMPPQHEPQSSAYHNHPNMSMAPPFAENFESFSTRGRPPFQDGAPPRPRDNYSPDPSMNTSSSPQPTFRQPGGPSERNIDDRHSADRPGFERVPSNSFRPVYNSGFPAPENMESSFDERGSHHPSQRSNNNHHLSSHTGHNEGESRHPPPPDTDQGPSGPPRENVSISWRGMNNNGGGAPPGSQMPYPPFSSTHRPYSDAGRGGYIRGGPGRSTFPGRGDGRGRAMRFNEIIAGRGGDILGGRGPPAPPPPPPSSSYNDYSSRPPLEYGGGRGRGDGRASRPPHTSPYSADVWPNRSLSRTESASNAKAISPPPPPPAPIEPPESPKPKEPEPVEPSGYMTALIRLADLEAQMEFEYAKHMHLLSKHRELKAQYELLENLPVGFDAIKDDLARLESQSTA